MQFFHVIFTKFSTYFHHNDPIKGARMERARILVPAIQGFFGKHIATYQGQLFPGDIPSILGHDPREWRRMPDELHQMYEDIQRRTSPQRREAAMQYVQARMGPRAFMVGAFPAICIGLTEAPVFTKLPGSLLENVMGDTSMGMLGLTGAGGSTRILLDGLARVSAMLKLIETLPAGMDVNEWLLVPVTFYAPRNPGQTLTVQELGQLFHDFNYLQARIAQSHAISLDQSDLYVQLTNQLARGATLMSAGGMDTRAASLGKASPALVVQQVFLRFVRVACEGAPVLTNNQKPILRGTLTAETFDTMLAKIEAYLSSLRQQMGPARFADHASLHLTSPGWQVLGLVFHDLHMVLRASDGVVSMVMERLGHIDWSRRNPDWIPLLGEPERDKETGGILMDATGHPRLKITRLGAAGIQALRDYVYTHTGLKGLLNEQAGQQLLASA
jgi:hypothetical protein